jgi:hypothetical protein
VRLRSCEIKGNLVDNADSDCAFCFVLLARKNQRIAWSRTSSIGLFIESVGCPDTQWRGMRFARKGGPNLAPCLLKINEEVKPKLQRRATD